MNIQRYTQLHGRYWKPNNQRFGSTLTRITGSQLKEFKNGDFLMFESEICETIENG